MKKQKNRLAAAIFAILVLCILTGGRSHAAELQPEDGEITAFALEGSVFDDVNEWDWFCSDVEYVLNKGIMTGKGDNLFAPAESIKRAQFATVLYRLSSQPPVAYRQAFSDIQDGQFYTNAVVWASQEEIGVVTGYADGRFGPADPITREQMATMLFRYARYLMPDFDLRAEQEMPSYPDAERVSDFARVPMEWALQNRIISGDGGRLNPQGVSSRAVCATMIRRFCEVYMPGGLQDVEMYAAYTNAYASAGEYNSGRFAVDIQGVRAMPGVAGVQVWAWSNPDFSNLYRYNAVSQGNGSYHVDGDIRMHGDQFGLYYFQIHICLSNGIRIHAGNLAVQVNGSEADKKIQKYVDAVYAQVGRNLNSCYWWVVNHMQYKRLPIPLTPPAGYTSAQWYALQAYETGRGNCFCYASAFYFLAKGLGYDAQYVEGRVGMAAGGFGPHGWVVIRSNGASYICDPEAQDEIGRYNFYMQPIYATVLQYRW